MRILMVLFILLSLATMIVSTTALSSGGTSVDTGGGFSTDCPCIDVSSVFDSASNCIVENTDNEPGVSLFTGSIFDNSSTCIPVDFGSNTCMQHTMSVYPSCQVDNYNISNQDDVRLPEFCYQSWCYVDKSLCRDSSHPFRRTQSFDFLPGADSLYYSSSTCGNNTVDHFTNYTTTQSTTGKFISAVVPDIWFPYHVKKGHNNNDFAGIGIGVEDFLYKNDNIPWKGYIIDYLDDVLDISDIGGLNYTHRSGGSSIVKQASTYTASVFDVKNEISCLGASIFWVTSERLEMTPFTTPLSIDKIMLWISTDNKSDTTSLYNQIINIGRPFKLSLWLTLIACLCIVSIMHIWFTTKKEERNVWQDKLREEAYKNGTAYFKITTLLNVLLDAFLDTAQMVFRASVDFDTDTYTSRKILNFGFGFLILITVANYTANLAAFLTTMSVKKPFINSIEDAIIEKVPLCAHIALQSNLIQAYPGAEWIFFEGNTVHEYEIYKDMYENFDNGRCIGIVAGIDDVSMDTKIMTEFCARNLVYTGSVVFEISVALPVCKDVVASISYWMYEAKQRGILYESYREKSKPTEVCPLSLRKSQLESDGDDSLHQLTLANFALPLLCLGICCVISTGLQIRHQRRRRHQRRTLLIRDKAFKWDEDEEKDKKMERLEDDIDQQQQQDQQQSLFQQPIVLPPIEDIQPNDSTTILQTLGEIQNYQDHLRNYQDHLQIYERNLVELVMKGQKNREHKE